jgi:tungstate transport system ATP-binding protein
LDVPHLEFYAGRLYAITGPNGAGKTTLLHLLALLEVPSAGQIFFNGKEVPAKSREALAVRRRVTLLMQTPVLLRTSVFSNVAYGLRLRRIPRRDLEARVETVLRQVQLWSLRQEPARQLSGGEAQRVALARALVLEPQVLLLDEPTANVDAENVAIIETLIREFCTRPETAVALTTHDRSQAERLADEVLRLEEGRLV